ncbi:mechanosensitive ion channel protein MscS [Phycicoccus sp. Root563]|uniref:mechanosensitive ion channel family protein n=1 Tax=unclassified Phycicoccus TaxID=2637926 RepID=UPI0007034DCD|nr:MULTISPECIES: mechanosensitive ion channel family protein [unclassified Phycicoccus]KQU66493.1 mechanosensitive ion channel protein MscS [Phycicoccus sp. Root101]KQZ87644.1 mechanosensitive ion channel protein MscS [Phycicoccus sp. Root563]
MPESFLHSLVTLTPEGVWHWFRGAPLQVVVTILAGVVLRWLALRSIKRVVRITLAKSDARRSHEPGRVGRAGNALAAAAGIDRERHRQRTLTMSSLLRSSATFVIALVTILTVMSAVGLDLAPLLATAGVGGVALGFGAQSLVKDFLSGIFMILEDQYGVGDVVDTGEAIGTVEEVSLRVTRLRDGSGVVWYIRNGEIIRIGNKSQGWSTAIVDLPVSYAENIERAVAVIRTVMKELDEDPAFADLLLEEPNVVGVESITGNVVTIRVIAKTAPEQQYGVSREIRERVKTAFDEHGIKAPVMTPFGPAGGTP